MRHFFNTNVAQMFHDANIATLFENLCYWIAHNKANNKNMQEIEINGTKQLRTFTYNSLSAFCQLFPYWSKRQIENYLNKLRDAKLIIKSSFNTKGFDRTAWYCLVDESYLSEFIAVPPEKGKYTSPKEETDLSETVQDLVQSSKQDEKDDSESEIIPISNGEIDIPEKGNAFPQTGKWTSPNGEMDFPETGNGFPQTGTPIPNNYSFKTNFKNTTAKLLSPEMQQHSQQILYLKNYVGKYFDPQCFSENFWNDLLLFLRQSSIPANCVPDYIDFVYDKTVSKKPESILNYFYKVVCKPYFPAQFFQDRKQKSLEAASKTAPPSGAELRTCPVCGCEYNKTITDCPTCNIPRAAEQIPEQTAFYKAKYQLQPGQKAALENELSNLLQQGGFSGYQHPAELKKQTQAIYAKYGIKQP